jgi:hypothetical protein
MGEPNDFLSIPAEKNISFRCSVEADLLIRHPVPIRGAYRDRHERGAGCGGRGGASDEGAGLRTAKSCGLTPRCWRQVLRSNPLMTVTNKPGHRGEHEETR